MQFADYRSYSAGDDPRQVDWNVYARGGNLVVRLFEEESQLDIHVVVDASRSMDFGAPSKFDAARRIAAALGHVALAQFDRLYLTAIDDRAGPTTGPLSGKDQASLLFAAVERMAPARGSDLASSLQAFAARFASVGLTILISDLMTPTWERGLRALSRRGHEIAVIHVLAPEEVMPTAGEELRLIDRETGRHVEIHLDDVALDAYARRFAAWTGAIERFCHDRAIRYARVDSDTPLETVLFDGLRRRGLVA